MSYAKQFLCDDCGKGFPLAQPLNTCPDCGGFLEVEYDLDAMKKDKPPLAGRETRTIWRYKHFLPPVTDENILSLGEGGTPLVKSRHIGSRYGINLYFKNDTMMPTGSFKDRGFSLALSWAKQLGIKRGFTYSSGNAGASFAAYSAYADMASLICVEYTASDLKKAMIRLYGAPVADMRFDNFDEISAMLRAANQELGLYQYVNFINPIRHEAMKTYAYEIFEDLGKAPDVMIHPVGTGGGLWGAYKGYKELKHIGYTQTLPRMIGVQPDSCAHFKQAFDEGSKEAGRYGDASKTIAQSIASDAPLRGGKRVLKAIYDTDGGALAVSEDEILNALRELAGEGIAAEPSSAAAVAAFIQAAESGLIKPSETAVCVITGTALKQASAVQMAAKGQALTMKADIGDLKRLLKEIGML